MLFLAQDDDISDLYKHKIADEDRKQRLIVNHGHWIAIKIKQAFPAVFADCDRSFQQAVDIHVQNNGKLPQKGDIWDADSSFPAGDRLIANIQLISQFLLCKAGSVS